MHNSPRMPGEAATTTYLVSQPFEAAVKALRRTLSGGNLRISGELNMSGRIERRLLIGTAPCLILFVSPSGPALEAISADPCAAELTPVHIVAAARDPETEIHVMRVLPSRDGPLKERTAAALSRFLTEVSLAIERIGMRTAVGV